MSASEILTVRTDGTERLVVVAVPADPAWSPDGTRLAFAHEGSIFVVNGDGSELRQLTSAPPEQILYSHPAWSRDGAKIAFSRYGFRQSRQFTETFVMNADGSGQVQVSDLGGAPRWSPDGGRIAFATALIYGGPGDESQVYVMQADGSELTQLTMGAGARYSVSWSPDGKRLAFLEDRSGASVDCIALISCFVTGVLKVVSPDGSASIELGAAFTSSEPRWSPDGTRIAFVQDEGGPVASVAPDGSSLTVIAERGAHPAWNPAGTKLTFDAPQLEGGTGIFIVNADGTGAVGLSPKRSGDSHPDWNPQ